MNTILPYAEFLAGIGCIILARLAFVPLKRYGAHCSEKSNSGSIVKMDEILVLGWILLVLVGISLMVYPFV